MLLMMMMIDRSIDPYTHIRRLKALRLNLSPWIKKHNLQSFEISLHLTCFEGMYVGR